MNKPNNSLMENSFFSIIKSGTVLLFPLITFAYASHILESNGLGRVDFAKSYTAYFSILAMLGITNYATREASKLRNDKTELSRFVHEILLINSFSALVACIIFFVTVSCVPHLATYKMLLYINSCSIVLSPLGMEWLYSAVENYKYISIRACIVQIVALMLTWMLVKDKNDIHTYAIIQVFSLVGANVMNAVHSRKYVVYKNLGNYAPMRHVKPIMYLFGMTLFIQVFTHMDSTMLGFMTNDNAVGLYAAATKMSNAVSGIMIAVTVVLAPRISYYVSIKETGEISQIVKAAVNYILLLGIPATVGLFLLAPQLIVLFAGTSFENAVVASRIMALRVFLVPMNTFIVAHLFIPMGLEKKNIITTGVAAAVNLCLNILFIPIFYQNGAAFATVSAEIIELIINLIFLSKIYNLKETLSGIWQYLLSSLPIIMEYFILREFFEGNKLVIIMVISSVITYLTVLCILKNFYVNKIICEIKNKIV